MKKLISVFVLFLTWQIGISQDFPPPGPIYLNIDNDSIYFSWQSPESKFLSHYNIYFNSCEDGKIIYLVSTTDTAYSQKLPAFHYRMNFGFSAEYLDPSGQSDTIWKFIIIPLILEMPVNIDFEDPSVYGIGMAACVLDGDDNWELIDSVCYSPEHSAAFFSDSIGSRSLLYTTDIFVDVYDCPIISFWAKIPEKQGYSDTLKLFWDGEICPTLYSIYDWQYFEYIDCGVEGVVRFTLDGISGGGSGIYIDDISIEDSFYDIKNAINNGLHLNIFPNPTTSFITIQIQEDIPVEQVIIYNHIGQKVLETKPVNNTLDVSMLKAGMYMIETVTDGTRYRTKMIKKN